MKTIKKRKKSSGVPRANPEDQYVKAVEQHLIQFGFDADIVKSCIEKCIQEDFYNMKMSEQASYMTKLILDLAGDQNTKKELISYFFKSENHRIRCRIPMMIHYTYKSDSFNVLERLKKIADDSATGPRENAQEAIRKLLISEGPDFFESIENLKYDLRENIRRACVEATRPRGVWVEHISFLKENPTCLYSLLDHLFNDNSMYVKTAIANSINDISKDNRDLAVKWCKEWKLRYGKSSQWIIKHGMRWLKKRGDFEVMELIGYYQPQNINIAIDVPNGKDIYKDEVVLFELSLENLGQEDLECCLQYNICKPNSRSKMYEGASFFILKGSAIKIIRRHHFTDTSNYELQEGSYNVQWLVNGFMLDEISLNLKRR